MKKLTICLVAMCFVFGDFAGRPLYATEGGGSETAVAPDPDADMPLELCKKIVARDNYAFRPGGVRKVVRRHKTGMDNRTRLIRQMRRKAGLAVRPIPRAARQASPKNALSLLHKKFIAKRALPPEQLRLLADSGDRLAAYVLAKEFETGADSARVNDAVHYYSVAAKLGQKSAVKPLAGLLRMKSQEINAKELVFAEAALAAAAQRGNTDSMYALSIFYRDGSPFERRENDSFGLLCQAALGGNADAAFLVGSMLSTGERNGEELELAKKMLGATAKDGNLLARALLEELEAGQ